MRRKEEVEIGVAAFSLIGGLVHPVDRSTNPDQEVVMATPATTPRSKKKSSLSLAAAIAALIAVIKAQFSATKPVTMNNVTTTWGAVIGVMQAFIDQFNKTASAKASYAAEVKAQKPIEVAARAQLKQLTRWAVGQFGEAAYAMFALPPPKVRAPKSTVAKAKMATKGKATRQANQQALAAVKGPSEEATVAAAIAGALAPSAPPASAGSAPSPAVPPVKA